jgi:hypothetical protein
MLHIVHPRPLTWRKVFTHMAEVLKVPLVTYGEWVDRLGTILGSLPDKELMNIPALKLLHSFRSVRLDSDEDIEAALPNVSIESAMKESLILDTVPQITMDDVDRWLAFWTKIGMI